MKFSQSIWLALQPKFAPKTLVETDSLVDSAATNNQTGEGVAIKKVTNVFSKKILAKRALREIKLLQHFRGHRNVCLCLRGTMSTVRPH